jgi:hypothetical protein
MSAPPPALRRAVATDGAWLAVWTASPEEVGISAELRALVARKEPNA